jgi:hypothetical protein
MSAPAAQEPTQVTFRFFRLNVQYWEISSANSHTNLKQGELRPMDSK